MDLVLTAVCQAVHLVEYVSVLNVIKQSMHHMIYKLCKLTLPFLIILISPILVQADFGYSLNLSNAETDNVLNDSSAVDSPIRSGVIGLQFYPIPQLEFSGSFKHTLYDEITNIDERGDTIITDITNSVYGFNTTWIPLNPDNKTNLYFNSSFDRVKYKDSSATDYDNTILKFTASIGYHFRPNFHLRGGTEMTSNNYLNDENIDADNFQVELFTGANFALPGSNNLDIESGFAITSLQAIEVDTFNIKPNNVDLVIPAEYLEDANIQNLYISSRLSRSIGKKTGVSLTFTYSNFTNSDKSVILDYSTSFLSPWSSFYDGTSTVFKLKTYIVPTFVVTTGAGYWDKNFLRAIESIREDYEIIEIDPRSGDTIRIPTNVPWYTEPQDTKYRYEWLSSLYIDLTRPIMFREILIEPSFSVVYKKNSSTSDAYDYSSTTFTFGLSLSGNF